jgi:hypothetical protein
MDLVGSYNIAGKLDERLFLNCKLLRPTVFGVLKVKPSLNFYNLINCELRSFLYKLLFEALPCNKICQKEKESIDQKNKDDRNCY